MPVRDLLMAASGVSSIPAIGSAYGGGYFAGQISTSGTGIATHNLVICDKAVGQSTGLMYADNTGVTLGSSSVINGASNTAIIIASGWDGGAASFCTSITAGGYTDWYLPALNELEVMYYYLKPTTATNRLSPASGSNANAVSPEPISTTYTAGAPAQTIATSFKNGASSQEFSTTYYWTSTESARGVAWGQEFSTGRQFSGQVTTMTTLYTRAIRKVAV